MPALNVGPRTLNPSQLGTAHIYGVRVTSESNIISGGAGVVTEVFDIDKETRKPILIRIENLGTTPVYWGENMSTCSAAMFSGVLGAAQVQDDGTGEKAEWQLHRPNNIQLFCASAYRVVIIKRYADEN